MKNVQALKNGSVETRCGTVQREHLKYEEVLRGKVEAKQL